MMYENIHLESANGVATLTLNRPQALNALTMELVRETTHALDTLRDEGTARALIITGAGRGFSSGADLAAGVANAGDGPRDAGISLERAYNPLIERLFALPMPIITAVNGPAAGAGCSIALCGDFVLAARSAYFLQAFVNIGLVPDAGATWILPRLIGRARATQMMMLGERIPAEQAESWGLIFRAVDDAALLSEATALATRLAAGPTQSYALIREGLRRAMEAGLTETLAMERVNQRTASRTSDFMEGVAAFLSKRKAGFTGK